ncbi:hypothetical protein J6590_048383, partial [Homalodisca vitripennis]
MELPLFTTSHCPQTPQYVRVRTNTVRKQEGQTLNLQHFVPESNRVKVSQTHEPVSVSKDAKCKVVIQHVGILLSGVSAARFTTYYYPQKLAIKLMESLYNVSRRNGLRLGVHLSEHEFSLRPYYGLHFCQEKQGGVSCGSYFLNSDKSGESVKKMVNRFNLFYPLSGKQRHGFRLRPVSDSQVESCVRGMRGGSAPGIDGLLVALLKQQLINLP